MNKALHLLAPLLFSLALAGCDQPPGDGNNKSDTTDPANAPASEAEPSAATPESAKSTGAAETIAPKKAEPQAQENQPQLNITLPEDLLSGPVVDIKRPGKRLPELFNAEPEASRYRFDAELLLDETEHQEVDQTLDGAQITISVETP